MSYVSSSGNCLETYACGAREVIHKSIDVDSDAGFQAISTSQIAQTRAMLDEPDFASTLAEVRAMIVGEDVEYEIVSG